jgi:hypothetical protein
MGLLPVYSSSLERLQHDQQNTEELSPNRSCTPILLRKIFLPLPEEETEPYFLRGFHETPYGMNACSFGWWRMAGAGLF